MKHAVQGIIGKINYIETDMELQKQILMSIPRGQEDQIGEVLEKIADLKLRVEELMADLKKIDPEEHQRIVRLEKNTEEFKKIAKGKKFKTVTTLDQGGDCEIRLKDGSVLACLVTALDEEGQWTIMTLEGETRTYLADEVAQPAVQ